MVDISFALRRLPKMKRAIPILLLFALSAAFGQEQDAKVYVKTVPILKILSSSEGYKVLYVKSNMQVGEIYLPLSWFGKAGGQAEIVFGKDPSFPYFSVFYKDGKFDFIRLYVIDDVKDLSWGILKRTEAELNRFKVDTLQIEY
jgi:hypothetical protein